VARYALLIQPSANRVYAEASVALTQAELAIFSDRVLGGRVEDVRAETLGGVPYVGFEAPALDATATSYLSNLSTAFALFAVEGELLRPVTLTPLDRYDDDLLTVLKYVGKTNETFTRLLLNITVLSTDEPEAMLGRLRVLDPLCGRGTTLNQATMYGYDATGLDLDGKDFDAYAAFLGRWLKDKRLKHRVEVHPVRREHRRVARRLEASFAPSKEEFKAGDVQTVTVVNADTTEAGSFLKGGSFDAIVTDAPYGVQHGSHGREGALARSPLDLLTEAVPGWVRLLRPGGALGLSWNTHVARREDLAALLESAGLEPLSAPAYLQLRHRVDRAITRDVLVARRPSR
jgi:SAM-dependent methyltransferase